MLTIFLDIDGVLNKESDWARPYTINPSCIKSFLSALSKLSNKEQVEIVLSSTWRTGFSKDGNHAPYIKDLLLHLNIVDITPPSNKSRQAEIEYYCKRNNISRYVVLDDDKSLFYNINTINLYLTNYKTGFCVDDIKKFTKYITCI